MKSTYQLIGAGLVLLLMAVTACSSPANSDPDPGTQKPGSPAAPVIGSVTPGERQLTVAWSAVENAGSYSVWYSRTDNSAGAVRAADGITGTRAVVSGLKDITEYYVWVRARNNAGDGGFSASMRETTFSASALYRADGGNKTRVDVPGDRRSASGLFELFMDEARDGDEFILELGSAGDDDPIPAGCDLRLPAGVAASIKLTGKDGTAVLQTGSGGGYAFFLWKGVTLTLGQGITVKGTQSNGTSLVHVYENSTLIMEAGSKITGNTTNGTSGGGVSVVNTGTFIMEGGEISGNGSADVFGGGVYTAGSFTMNGGKISGNSSADGAGIHVDVTGNFTLNGGEITGNRAASAAAGFSFTAGGGVSTSGTFTMTGGTISGNTAPGSGNTIPGYGGGVFIGPGGTFSIEAGTIGNNSASSYGGDIFVWGSLNLRGAAPDTIGIALVKDTYINLTGPLGGTGTAAIVLPGIFNSIPFSLDLEEAKDKPVLANGGIGGGFTAAVSRFGLHGDAAGYTVDSSGILRKLP
ncbi:fibronectin type III domain-containing protein [Breznakiella homolactica]|uniref:Fibronectin type III domain-containing protein n=1 Tax=Breznakiella homolactica TaxID=2798577 RepID=A0A7T7XMR3_9SPIR|nr:fibronectin type III domain-containing protein [Breznakiella homolactica]QQO09209.1 fibronectin type III domain-containing protein [Breznakiella homolactica]